MYACCLCVIWDFPAIGNNSQFGDSLSKMLFGDVLEDEDKLKLIAIEVEKAS